MATLKPETRTTRDGREFLVRAARPDDAAALLRYVRSVAQRTEFFMIEADEFDFSEEQECLWIQNHINRPGWLLLLAEAAGEIIAVVSFENGERRRIAHRGSLGLSVAEAWRQQGIGTTLLEMLLAWAAESPLVEKVCLEVFTTNEKAIRLYKKLGFVDEGLRPKDIKIGPGRYVDTIAMYRFV